MIAWANDGPQPPPADRQQLPIFRDGTTYL